MAVSSGASSARRGRSRGVGEREHTAGKLFRLLNVRKMPGLLDLLEFRTGDQAAIAAAVLLAEDTVGRAPQKQRRDLYAMQPALEFGVVHVGRPCDPGVGLAVARGRKRLCLRQIFVIAFAGLGIEISQRVELV